MGEYKYLKSKLEFSHSEQLGALANAALVKLLLKLPAQTASFFGCWLDVCCTAFGTTLSGVSLVEVCETPTTSVDGTARTPQNGSRLDVPPAFPGTLFLNTDATAGTVLHAGNALVGVKYDSPCRILKPATNYLVRVTNQSGGALTGGTLTLGLKVIPTKDYLYHSSI